MVHPQTPKFSSFYFESLYFASRQKRSKIWSQNSLSPLLPNNHHYFRNNTIQQILQISALTRKKEFFAKNRYFIVKNLAWLRPLNSENGGNELKNFEPLGSTIGLVGGIYLLNNTIAAEIVPYTWLARGFERIFSKIANSRCKILYKI